jgi:hypothetical protein
MRRVVKRRLRIMMSPLADRNRMRGELEIPSLEASTVIRFITWPGARSAFRKKVFVDTKSQPAPAKQRRPIKAANPGNNLEGLDEIKTPASIGKLNPCEGMEQGED